MCKNHDDLFFNLYILHFNISSILFSFSKTNRMKRRTKNAKAFHDKCENAYLGCWVWG
ncbi:hypothetical protein ACTMNS_04765 [Staphylococcus haemolyticus]